MHGLQGNVKITLKCNMSNVPITFLGAIMSKKKRIEHLTIIIISKCLWKLAII